MRCRIGTGLIAAATVGCLAIAGDASAKAVSPFSERFGGGNIGAKPTSANTAYDQSIGDRGDGSGNMAVVFARNGFRGHCVRFYNTRVASSTFGFLGKRVNRQSRIYLRRYYYLDVRPRSRTSVLLYKFGGNGNGQLGGTHNGSFAFGGDGQSHKFTLVNNNTNVTTSRSVVPVHAWFRVEVKLEFTSGHGVQTVRLFLGRNVNGATPTEMLTGRLTGTYTDYIEDGIVTNPNARINVRIDEAANRSAWIGPVR